MIRAYALYRRSRSHQDLSIEEQREAVRAWAAANGYEIVREFSDSASGLNTEQRHEFLTLLHLCAEPRLRQADTVLCYDVSRFSRLDPEEAGFHEYSLRRAGVRVIYTHEPGANEAGITGHLVKSLKRVLAHDYSHKLSQVVQRGLRAHAARGQWAGGRPPYGYRRAIRSPDGAVRQLAMGEWKAKGQTVTLTIDSCEADVVRERIYGAYLRGHGLSSIATMLNAAGIPAPVSDRRIGTMAWTKGTIWAILRNPMYKGTLVYAKARYSEIGKKRGKVSRPESDRVVVPNAAPAIVSAEVWAAVQAKHGTRKFGIGRPWHHPYLLSGLIVCGHCGKRFRAHKQVRGRERAYYICGGYTASGLNVCDGLRIPLSYLETAVLDGIQKRLEGVLDRRALRGKLLELLHRAYPDDGALEILERQLTERQRKIGRLVDVLASGVEDLPSVREALVGLERERERLQEELAAAKARADYAAATPENVEATVEALTAGLARLPDVLESGEAEERKAVVLTFLQRIRIDKTRRQAILTWYRLPRLENPSSPTPLSSTTYNPLVTILYNKDG